MAAASIKNKVESMLFSDVTLTSILIVIIKTIVTLFTIIMAILSWGFGILFSILSTLFVILCIVGGILGPIFIVFFIIYLMLSIFWDGGARPVMSIIQSGINFAVGLWNSVARALRKFGVKLDRANGFSMSVPTFWEFLKYIIYTLVWNPIKSALKGVVFR